MFGKIAVVLSSIILALVILTVSIFRGAGTRYAFSSIAPTPKPDNIEAEINIDYQLAYPGKIIPDHPLWYIKALRDRLKHLVAFSSAKQAELNLLCADKRVQMAQMLFEKGKPDLGYETLKKSEMYLAKSLTYGHNDTQFLQRYAKASLKHRELIEENVLPLAPEDLKPFVVKTMDVTIDSYNKSYDLLKNKGEDAPINPFEFE